jgi:hypothetical protein
MFLFVSGEMFNFVRLSESFRYPCGARRGSVGASFLLSLGFSRCAPVLMSPSGLTRGHSSAVLLVEDRDFLSEMVIASSLPLLFIGCFGGIS